MRAKHRWLIQSIGVWPSGKAADFGSAIPGSNPGTPAFTQCGGAFLTDRDTSTALPASPSGVGYKGGQRLLPRLHVGGLRRYIDEKAGSPGAGSREGHADAFSVAKSASFSSRSPASRLRAGRYRGSNTRRSNL